MQKYLWGGAALIVAAAAAAYVTVDYAARHPESFLGQCSSAIVYGGATAVSTSCGTDAQTGDEEQVAPAPSISKPTGVVEPVEQTVEPIQVESIPPVAVDAPPTGWQNVNEEFDWRPFVEITEDAPKPMPYADEEDMTTTRWGRGLIGRNWRCPPDKPTFWNMLEALQRQSNIESAEECEVPAMPSWLQDVIESIHNLFGSGCHTWEAIPVLPVEDGIEEEKTEGEEQTEMKQEHYQNYHHYHQGCPYMGGCPYYPRQSAVEIPVDRGSKASDDEATLLERKKKLMLESMMWNWLLKKIYSHQSFSWPFTDTMEFRPSDAGKYPVQNETPF